MSETDTTRHHAHHFENADAEFEASKQGMWVFLVTEVLMFGGLFVGYLIMKNMYFEDFRAAHHELNWKMGALNTLILISSSVTMLLGVTAAQRGQRGKSFAMLGSTIALAAGFLVVKYFEYAHKFHDGLLTAGYFTNKELLEHHPKAPLFFSYYFVMTGLHGLHVLIGMALITWIMIRTKRNEFGPNYFTPVELVGFYWHFVDLVWIYLFPLVYLVG